MPPFTNATLTDWFDGAQNIGLATRTRTALAGEGIIVPSNLVDFKDLDTVYVNLCKPPKVMGYPTVDDRTNLVNGRLADQELFLVSTKSKKQLDVALMAIKYYKIDGRPLGSDNMAYATLKNSEVEYSALVERETDTEAHIPKLDKGMTDTKWLEYFKVRPMSIIGNGVFYCTMLYALNLRPRLFH